MSAQRGQVLVFFAFALPLVLLPVAAYAVDASLTASSYSRLVEVTARAAEETAQQIDVARLREGRGLAIDVIGLASTVRDVLAAGEPRARLIDLSVMGAELRLVTTETVVLPFNTLGSPDVTLRATISARIAAGYDSPSSLLPLPASTF